MGDPCGIGPEIILRARARRSVRNRAQFVIVGTPGILRAAARCFSLDASFLRTVRSLPARTDAGCVHVVNAHPLPSRFLACGEATAEGGAACLSYIRHAVELIRSGSVHALVTAPINKYALLLAGSRWPGHTEFLGHLAGGSRPVMMMVGGGLRAALVTTHCAVRNLPRLITERRVLGTIRIVARDLERSFGIREARIAVCGLNPHAGEAGRFGSEEKRSIEPAVHRAADEGIRCIGPLPADIVFHQMLSGRYDAIVAMFHDQANIPVKTLAFDQGVNVTLGLPIIRTSPDHGTAYDIAASGKASARSMVAAIRLAVAILRNRARAL